MPRVLPIASIIPILAALLSLPACATTTEEADDSPATEDALVPRVSAEDKSAVARQSVRGYRLEHPTRTGTAIFQAALYWRQHQLEDRRYPQPRMCASNVSKVLYLAGVERYSAEGVYNLIRSVGSQGGRVYRLPQPTVQNGKMDKRAFLAMLNSIDEGKIPVGMVVAGCLTAQCDAMPGEQHVGVVGQVDADGTVWVWHNNWYRPENEGGQWKNHMIYTERRELYEVEGLKRQWMATPWIKIKRDFWGKIVDAQSVLPAIDDMDPFGGAYGGQPRYNMTLVVLPEMTAELDAR